MRSILERKIKLWCVTLRIVSSVGYAVALNGTNQAGTTKRSAISLLVSIPVLHLVNYLIQQRFTLQHILEHGLHWLVCDL
jgi:hypothetical protein